MLVTSVETNTSNHGEQYLNIFLNIIKQNISGYVDYDIKESILLTKIFMCKQFAIAVISVHI